MTDATRAEPLAPVVRSDGSAAVAPEERERRLLLLAEALLDGRAHRELVETAVQTWGVSRRTAQVYAQEVEGRLHAEAHHLPPLFALELSQMQRSRFLRGLVERSRRNGELSPRDYCTLLVTANKLLDSRDRSAVRMLEHQKREKSAQEDAIISDFKDQVCAFEQGEKEARQRLEARTQPPLPARFEPCASPTPAEPSREDSAEEENQDDEDIDESQLSEEEKAELRVIEEVADELHPADPTWRAGWLARTEPHADLASLIGAKREPPGASSDPSRSVRDAPAPGANPNPSPNASRQQGLRAARKQRRQERKRLRRLRKRRRGGS